MGRTLPSMTQVFYQEQESFADFRRALRRSDQLALDDLFVAARKHISAAAHASHPLPFEIFLLTMLLEEHKETLGLRQEVAQLKSIPALYSASTSALASASADANAEAAGNVIRLPASHGRVHKRRSVRRRRLAHGRSG